jgi:beta-galactosidase
MWVMEQQPGPVNWAAYNPAPLPGMVRAWTWEAIAHGAELVSYFRWRQAPFAQEQFHAGLHLPDGTEDVGGEEARQVAAETRGHRLPPPLRPGAGRTDLQLRGRLAAADPAAGPQLAVVEVDLRVVLGLRQLGLDVDIVPPDAALDGYRMVVAPSLPVVDDRLVDRLAALDAPVLLGPRSGSKTRDVHIPAELPPGPLQRLLPLKVVRVESLRSDTPLTVVVGNTGYPAHAWREDIRSELEPLARFDDGGGAWWRTRARRLPRHLAGRGAARPRSDRRPGRAGLQAAPLPEGRPDAASRRADRSPSTTRPSRDPRPRPMEPPFVLGGPLLPPAGVAAWRGLA